ncbi:uncharacterized protein BXZ73DRAFT_93060 [Epithele typhae]|uniref:uncharacterized protein n=1 Tax=Epithele typhae TaxID=378194 RepID=UPI002007A6E6|nr:uncharacterized protein BXZ73DRAFT_93060 [Epithele typhae]KAH9912861.1 hypothetical protein BXZ73DRAFT_93060 [Epithele typhae]
MPPNPLSLKQRLAALSANLNSPSRSAFDAPPDSPLTAKRKSFFKQPFRKNSTSDNGPPELYGHERIQEVMSRLIFQAGVDYEIVMCAAAMPDPQDVSYDLLLSRILSYLDLYVESDYTVVFLAAGNRHTPGWNWVWKAYRSLSRKYRKNLKRLFFRKITYINTLSELAYHNLKHEKQIQLPVMTRSDLFGVPLEELMGFDGEKGGLPRVVRDCIQYLRATGLQDEGLFRRSPNSVLLKQAAQAYDRGHVVSLDTFGDPHLAAMPYADEDLNDMAAIMYIREILLPELPPCVYILLNSILHLLYDVQRHSAANRMDAHNLTVVICPNLVSSSNPMRDVMMCSVPNAPTLFDSTRAASSTNLPSQLQSQSQGTPSQQPPRSPSQHHASLSAPPPPPAPEGKTTLGMVIKLCIQRYYEVFDDVPDRSEALAPDHAQDILHHPDPAFAALGSPGSPSLNNRDSALLDDDDIDDAMLVMPLGPGSANPSRFSSAGGHSTFRPHHRTGGSRDVTARSVGGGGPPSAYATVNANRTRSTISIERGHAGGGAGGRKGSIALGRGTQRGTGKGAGAGVTAVSITAEGFFSAPDAPPVPALPAQDANGDAQ